MADFRAQYGNEFFGFFAPPYTEDVEFAEAIDTSRGFAWSSNVRGSSSGRNTVNTAIQNNDDIGGEFMDPTAAGFTIERQAASELANHRYYYQTLEDRLPAWAREQGHGFDVLDIGGFRMQGGASSTTTAVVPGITDLDRCAVWPISLSSSATIRRYAAAHTLRRLLNPGGEMRLFRGNTNNICDSRWAVLQFGSQWEVETVLASTTTRGSEVVFSGAGPRPWSQKFLVATWAVPNAGSSLASNPIFYAGENPDEIRFYVDNNAAAGTYWMNAYVCYHPLLQVEHQNTLDGDFGQIDGSTETHSAAIPNGAADPSDVTLLSHVGGESTATGYASFHYGYELDGDNIRWRHGRPITRSVEATFQAIRWFTLPRYAGGVRGHTTTPSSHGIGRHGQALGSGSSPLSQGHTAAPTSRGHTSSPGSR